MNDNISDQVIDSSNLPANKKAKAIQKRRAAENSYEALQLKKSAAIYLRVSSEMQVDGFSIEAQKIACLKYANEQGYEVTDSHIYIDEAYSAKNEDRPEFKRLMIAAHSSEFSLIIIHKMDRFERNFRARFTGKQISRTTIKASSNPVTKSSTGINDVKKAIDKGNATQDDIIYGPEGTKQAAKDAGLVNPVEEKNTVQDIRDSIERQKKKIAEGRATIKPTAEQIAGQAFQGAIVGGAVSLSISAITSYLRYRNGEITREQAFTDISEDSVRGLLVGGTLGGITIFIPGGTIGVIAGNAVGIYVNASFTNILDEIYGKGEFGALLDASGYICGLTKNLSYCLKEIEQNNRIIDKNIREASDTQKDIESLLGMLED